MVNRAVDLGHLRDDLDVEQFVWELCGIYLGHHAANRFLRATDAGARAHTAFAALPEAPCRSSAEGGGAERGKNRETFERFHTSHSEWAWQGLAASSIGAARGRYISANIACAVTKRSRLYQREV
jgi:tetracycline repressor-like protein